MKKQIIFIITMSICSSIQLSEQPAFLDDETGISIPFREKKSYSRTNLAKQTALYNIKDMEPSLLKPSKKERNKAYSLLVQEEHEELKEMRPTHESCSSSQQVQLDEENVFNSAPKKSHQHRRLANQPDLPLQERLNGFKSISSSARPKPTTPTRSNSAKRSAIVNNQQPLGNSLPKNKKISRPTKNNENSYDNDDDFIGNCGCSIIDCLIN